MSSDLLKICEAYLQRRYNDAIGFNLGGDVDQLTRGRSPVWRLCSGLDLISVSDSTEGPVVGQLLDPEIGLLLYVIPFKEGSEMRGQIMRALKMRSVLEVGSAYSEESAKSEFDDRGAWRIVVHWLVEERLRQAWMKEVIEIRRQTSFSEDLALDAVFFSAGRLEEGLKAHGLPRLLLATRTLLKKRRQGEVSGWLSANELVRNAVTLLASHFHSPEQIAGAKEIVDSMLSFRTVTQTGSDHAAQRVSKLRVRDFRNIGDVAVDFGNRDVSAWVVHGPNGTGKSSLCEALSIALFNSSTRYRSFVDSDRESDVVGRDRPTQYVQRILTPINRTNREPKIGLNDRPLEVPHLVGIDDAKSVDLAIEGTILTQEASLEFSKMSSAELSVRVLRDYSELADHVEDFTERRLQDVERVRQDFMRENGISLQVTRLDTALVRIGRRAMDPMLPEFPRSLVGWLEQAESLGVIRDAMLSQVWNASAGEPSRASLADGVAEAAQDPSRIRRMVAEWLTSYNGLISQSKSVIERIKPASDSILSGLEDLQGRIDVWGAWLEKQSTNIQPPASSDQKQLSDRLAALQKAQQEIVERGQSARSQLDHLERVLDFLQGNWSKQHPNDCPTCGTDHQAAGGILEVVKALHVQRQEERKKVGEEYKAQQDLIAVVEKELVALGHSTSPVGEEEKRRLSSLLSWLVPDGSALAQWLSVKAQRQAMVQALNLLKQLPSIPAEIDVNTRASQVAEAVGNQYSQAARVFDAPSVWKPVRAKLTELLASVVDQHLPDTLALVWSELVLNITSAPWLLPARPRITLEVRRQNKRSTVTVEDRLARYVLNQSELHTLGIGWFFTRYLTQGRFTHSCMIMDDPAQEMDQTSYRDLCRLWETWMRLHRVYEHPLRLIVMLNQERRAIEAARVTGGVLSVLSWTAQQDGPLSQIRIMDEAFVAPSPLRLFALTGS